MSEHVDRVGGCFGWFFVIVSIILLICLLSSCNPFISKELRQKKKCNRKLERVIKKCPELLNTDTIRDTVEIIIPKVEIDSFIDVKIDTMRLDSIINLIKDTTTQRIIWQYFTNEVYPKDTIKHQIDGFSFAFWFIGNKMHYSVDKPSEIVEKEIEIPIEVVKPIQLTVWQQLMNCLSPFFWPIVVLIIIILVFKIIMKKIKG
jgi:hypothetical protein